MEETGSCFVGSTPSTDVGAPDEVLVAKTRLEGGALRLPEALMQSITETAPAFTLFFFIQGTVVLAVLATPFVYLVGIVIMVMLAVTLAQIARYLSSAGGFFTWVSRGTSSSSRLVHRLAVCLVYPATARSCSWTCRLHIRPVLPGQLRFFGSVGVVGPWRRDNLRPHLVSWYQAQRAPSANYRVGRDTDHDGSLRSGDSRAQERAGSISRGSIQASHRLRTDSISP